MAITRKDFLEAHIEKVQASIFNNETLIKWGENGGDVPSTETEKAKVSIEKDKKWLNFLENELQVENN